MTEPVVMDAVLAVAASHHSRRQKLPDSTSQDHLRRALKGLQCRCKNPASLRDPVTVITMLLIVSYEIFAGSHRWQSHFQAIRSWTRSQDDNSKLDPFIKSWICLIETQSALNMAGGTVDEIATWMQARHIDPLIGCSIQLLWLMSCAARLFSRANSGIITNDELRQGVTSLQREIKATKINVSSEPLIATLCDDDQKVVTTDMDLGLKESSRRIVAAAEIFRHALHIYVYRMASGGNDDYTGEIAVLVQDALKLISLVPGITGPATTLGWGLLIIGSEVDDPEQRAYIQSRIAALHLLGINTTRSAERILEKVWEHRDLVHLGQASPKQWQYILKDINELCILY